MTKWTSAHPRPGACVHFGTVDTRLCSEWTPKWTPSTLEVDSEVDTPEVDTLHAHEVDKQREIHTGIDVSGEYPNTWRLYAECPDATTDILVVGDVLLIPADSDAFAASEWPMLLLAEHLDRCEDCATWRKRASA